MCNRDNQYVVWMDLVDTGFPARLANDFIRWECLYICPPIGLQSPLHFSHPCFVDFRIIIQTCKQPFGKSSSFITR